MDWSKYAPFFSPAEFACRHTGRHAIQAEFMDALLALRQAAGFPFFISSGYRHPTHPIEARKIAPGAHATGMAADIRCYGPRALWLVQNAPRYGFTGIGVSQKGSQHTRFIHLDTLGAKAAHPRPWIWSY